MGDLISRSAVIDILKETGIIQDNDMGHLAVDEINRISTAYDVDAVVEQIQNINTTWNCQECEHLEICDKIQMEKGNGGEHLDLCAEVVKALSVDIVRKGGKE